jgi:hypothetical protein
MVVNGTEPKEKTNSPAGQHGIYLPAVPVTTHFSAVRALPKVIITMLSLTASKTQEMLIRPNSPIPAFRIFGSHAAIAI